MRSIFRLLRCPLPVVLFCLVTLALLSLAASRSAAATYYVATTGSDSNAGTLAAPFLTIQQGINTAVSGDTVTVEDGTYTGPGNVDLDFGGRNLTVQSQNGAAKTIIDCQGSSSANHRGFYLHSGETNAVISALTIKNGYEYGDGGGIFNSSLGATIQNCILEANTAVCGGGMYNSSSGNGAITVNNCLLMGNIANSDGLGGAIYNASGSSVPITVINCTITGNSAGDSGGIYSYVSSTSPVLTNDIVYGDSGGEVGGAVVSVSYCDIQGGYYGGYMPPGEIDADPLFVNSPTDLHLQPGSPCLGAGTASGAPTTTLDGYTRPNPPSIGAYELAPVPPPTNLTATAGVGKVTLTWIAPAGVSGVTYSVFRGTASGGETFYKTANTATNFVNTYVTVGTTYYYTVQTIVNGRASSPSNEASATPTAAASVPAAPTNVNAVAGVGKVTLTWAASPGTVTSYSVYRGTSATALTFYKTAGTATSFVNTYVVNGTTYYYAIVALNSAGSSPQSSVVSATPQGIAVPGVPQNLTAVASGGKITLTWTASTGTVTIYSVYRGTASGAETFYKTAYTATTFVNSYVTAGTKYFYYVTALNSSGSSLASNEVSATP